ncbi:MAG: hypothetical protein ACFE0P_09910 [Oceanicaulis sp.]
MLIVQPSSEIVKVKFSSTHSTAAPIAEATVLIASPRDSQKP